MLKPASKAPCISSFFYIKPQLSLSAVPTTATCISSFFYIKPQPSCISLSSPSACISSFFYIKPQPTAQAWIWRELVYHPFSTSNHNCWPSPPLTASLVYHPFSTSNHNCGRSEGVGNGLYIILFLHQTTTRWAASVPTCSCISSFFYIKPQPMMASIWVLVACISSFFYIKPQHTCRCSEPTFLVYHPFSTSNHNWRSVHSSRWWLVYHPFSTSNHNIAAQTE